MIRAVSARARTQAMEALTEAHAVALKLPTVKRRYRALAEPLRCRYSPLMSGDAAPTPVARVLDPSPSGLDGSQPSAERGEPLA